MLGFCAGVSVETERFPVMKGTSMSVFLSSSLTTSSVGLLSCFYKSQAMHGCRAVAAARPFGFNPLSSTAG